MYTSDPAETDDTPFITANGEEVKQGTIACPQRYKFGTKVIIRNVEYKCNDRMHSKYKNNFDIWVGDKQEALSFGRQSLKVQVYD